MRFDILLRQIFFKLLGRGSDGRGCKGGKGSNWEFFYFEIGNIESGMFLLIWESYFGLKLEI